MSTDNFDPSNFLYQKGKEFLQKNDEKTAEYFFINAAQQGNIESMEILVEKFLDEDEKKKKYFLKSILEKKNDGKLFHELSMIYYDLGKQKKVYTNLKKSILLGYVPSMEFILENSGDFIKFSFNSDESILDKFMEKFDDLVNNHFTPQRFLLTSKKHQLKCIELLKNLNGFDCKLALAAAYKFGIGEQNDEKCLEILNEIKNDYSERVKEFHQLCEDLKNKKCTFKKDCFNYQPIYDCLTCGLYNELNAGVCETCYQICHKDHLTKVVGLRDYQCDCHTKSCECQK